MHDATQGNSIITVISNKARNIQRAAERTLQFGRGIASGG